jgi:hypothetical protein
MAAMEFDSRSADRLPFHDPDEAEQALAAAPVPSRDAQRRHLQRVPLFSEFNEDELRRVAELSRIVEVPMGTAVATRRIRSSSSSTASPLCPSRQRAAWKAR